MKVQIEGLKKALALVSVGTIKGGPAFVGALLRWDGVSPSMSLSCFDGDMVVSTAVPVTVEPAGLSPAISAFVDISNLSEAVKRLTVPVEITFSVETKELILSAGNVSVFVPASPVTDGWPNVAMPSRENVAIVSSRLLAASLRRTCAAVVERDYPSSAYVNVVFEASRVHLAATDRFRMSVDTFDGATVALEGRRFNLPFRAANAVLSAIKQIKGRVHVDIALTDERVAFWVGDTTLVSVSVGKLQFFDAYRSIIPELRSGATTIMVGRGALLAAMRACKPMRGGRQAAPAAVRLLVGSNDVEVVGGGDRSAKVVALVSGDAGESNVVTLDYKFLLAAIESFDSSEVIVIDLTTLPGIEYMPVVLFSSPTVPGYRHLLIPIVRKDGVK